MSRALVCLSVAPFALAQRQLDFQTSISEMRPRFSVLSLLPAVLPHLSLRGNWPTLVGAGYLLGLVAVVMHFWEIEGNGTTLHQRALIVWGQPERRTGEFYKICFGNLADRWNHRRVDSRTSIFTNKELIAEWLRDYGEESDWFRVRVLGLPPTADEVQFIDTARIRAARMRRVEVLADEPTLLLLPVPFGPPEWRDRLAAMTFHF